MKAVKKTIAAMLLLSTLISGCSVKDDEQETVSSDASETQETAGTTAASNMPLTEPMAPAPDSPVVARMSDAVPEEEAELNIPSDAYNVVIDSILNYIDNYDPADPDLTYIGKGEFSGIEEAILGGDPYNDIGYAYVDVDWDNVAELAILDLTDDYGYMVLELYSYNSNYGFHPIFHGYSNDRYYLYFGGYLRKRYVDEDTMSYESYIFTDTRSGTMFMEGCYTMRMADGLHFLTTYYEDHVFSSTIDSYYVNDLDIVSESDVYYMFEGFVGYEYTEYPQHYETITPLSEY